MPPPLQLNADPSTMTHAAAVVQRNPDEEESGLMSRLGPLSDILGFGGEMAESALHTKNAAWAKMAGISTSQAVGATPFLTALGGLTGGIGLYNGVNDAMDSSKSMPDRVVGGMGAFGGGTSVLSALTSIPKVGAALKGTSLAKAAVLSPAGKLAGAFAGGYGIGSLINNANNSDYARDSRFGQDASGRDRTLNDLIIDKSVGLGQSVHNFTGNETAGHIIGGGAAALGTVAAAPFALGNAAGGWINKHLRGRR